MLKRIKLFTLALLSQLMLSSLVYAQDAVVTFTGTVDSSSGSIAVLVAPGDTASGWAIADNSIQIYEEVDENDGLDGLVVIGNVCIAVDTLQCPPGTLTFDALANPNNPNSYAQPGTLITLDAGGVLIVAGLLQGQKVEGYITFGSPDTDVTENGIRTLTGTATVFVDGSADPNIPGEIDLGDATGSATYELSGPIPNYTAPTTPLLFNVLLFAALVLGWRKYKASVV